MYFSIIFLPFINFFSNIIFGRFLGKKGSFILTLLTMFFTMLLSFFIFYEVVLSHSITIISLFN